MHYWLTVLPKSYGIADTFNHNYVVKHRNPQFQRTLEIGAGTGEHLHYEKLTEEQQENYIALDVRDIMLKDIKKNFPKVQAVMADCQKTIPFGDSHFDRIIAIHVLEHLCDLPSAIKELYRVCDKQSGQFAIVIPCEGSLALSFARKISAQRIFEKRYKQSYDWFIKWEHVNKPYEIIEEICKYFKVVQKSFFPLFVPIENCNLCIGMTFVPREHTF